jgi:two-component system cell cycle sensor histidine kinase/response regulator CckA
MAESDDAQIESKRRRAEDELRRTGELLRAVADEVTDAIYVKDRGGKYLLFNKAASRLTERSAAEVLGRDDTAIFDVDSARIVMERDRRVMAAGVAETEEVELTAAGVTRTYLATKAPFRDERGNIVGVIGISHEITDRKRAEQQSRVTAERLHAVIAGAPMVIWAIDRDGIKTLSVGKLLKKWGREENEMVGRSIFEAAQDVPEMLDAARRVLKGESLSGVTTAGAETFEWWYYPLRAENQAITGAIGVAIDITDRKRAEDALRRNERLLRQVLNALPVGVVVTDLSGDVVLSNPASKRIWGGMITSGAERYAKSMGWWHGTRKRIGPDEWPSLQAFTTGQSTVNELIDIEAFDGVRKVIENSAAPILDDDQAITGAVVINEDVTDVLRLEDQFRQAQKMEAVGQLAGGVVHDFNNLLTIINGYSEIIQTQLPADSPVQKLVREIDQAGERAASLTRQLLAFSRKQVLEPKVLNLNAVVTDTAKILQRLIGEDIELNTALEPSLGLVRVDPGQIEQVLMNLAVNARDAMPQGGKLALETANVDLDATYTQAYPDLLPGPYVMVAVSDTGMGMDEATKAHIFEPFFTTKQPGKGTGLGLATVFGIVRQSNGHIAVSSEPGRGATFKIYLPVVAGVISSPKPHPDPKSAPRGNETILLTEDDSAVRALARHALQMHGYTVLEAGQGDKALHVAEECKGTIHLLVTDVVMPVMSGRELAERLAAIRPGLRVLYLSGYTDDAVIRHGVSLAETAFLEKPFTPSSLATKVREVLDQ